METPPQDIIRTTTDVPNASQLSRALHLDINKYQHFLDDSDLSEIQKRQFIEALWTIILGFVDLGFGIQPLPKADQDSCGKNSNPACASPDDLLPLLDSCKSGKITSASKAQNGGKR